MNDEPTMVQDGVCNQCGALVQDVALHVRWHDELLASINELRTTTKQAWKKADHAESYHRPIT